MSDVDTHTAPGSNQSWEEHYRVSPSAYPTMADVRNPQAPAGPFDYQGPYPESGKRPIDCYYPTPLKWRKPGTVLCAQNGATYVEFSSESAWVGFRNNTGATIMYRLDDGVAGASDMQALNGELVSGNFRCRGVSIYVTTSGTTVNGPPSNAANNITLAWGE